MKTDSALSYFGADGAVARQLAAMLDHCSHVTIPFCAGMSILQWLTARAVVANDLNENAINFYRVMSGVYGSDSRRWLVNRCGSTLSHPSELKMSRCDIESADRAIRAWAYWALSWLTRKGTLGTINEGNGSPSIRWTANGGTNASRIRAAAEDLPAWAEHFRRCEWLCADFRTVLAKVRDELPCGIYCDPPWVGLGDSYLHSFREQDHIDLRDRLERFEAATVVVRYGDHPFIRDLFAGPRWTIVEAASRTQSNAMTGEIWITNRKQ